MTMTAELRCCASCEWIFRLSLHRNDCPKCGFASYGARYCFGVKAYAFARTQQPWLNRQITKLRSEIERTRDKVPTPTKDHA